MSINKEISQIINRLLVRMLIIGVFLVLCQNITEIKNMFQTLSESFFQLAISSKQFLKLKKLYKQKVKSFISIILSIFVLLPIFQRLTSEISADTIYLNFFICQIVYCIVSIQSSILKMSTTKKSFERSCVIPLDESLLITKKFNIPNDVSSIAVSLGFILIFSRINSKIDVIILQIVGFLLYFYVPEYLEELKLDQNKYFISSLVLLSCLSMYVIDSFAFVIFSWTVSIIKLSVFVVVKFVKSLK